MTIGANAHAGSFGVSVSNGSLVGGLLSSVGLKSSNTVTLTANVGLTKVAPNNTLDADGITFLYNPVVSQNPNGVTKVTVVAVVGANAGSFDEIQLTDSSGSQLNYEAISGNSGSEYTNLNPGSVVTLILKIPAGQTSTQFYARTKEDGVFKSQGTVPHPLTLSPLGTGILSLSTPSVNLSHAVTESTSVTLTYTNIGTGTVSGISVGEATAPIVIDSNSCASSLSPASSCKVVLRSTAGVGVADTGSFTTSYTNVDGNIPLTTQYNYAGIDPESGISLEAVNSFNFTANTVNGTESTLVTLTNQSANTTESDFEFSFNSEYFQISVGSGNNACALSGNKVTSTLAPKADCNLILTYANNTKTSPSTDDMTVNYLYHGDRQGNTKKVLSYTTSQAKASLSFVPLIHDFGTIVANREDSESFDYVLMNAGPDEATNIQASIQAGQNDMVNAQPLFSIVNNTCDSTLAAGSNCKVTVKFGPTGNVLTSETVSLVVDYKSKTDANTPETTKSTVVGTSRAPLSANPVITSVSFTPLASGGSGDSSDPFAIEHNKSNQKLTLTYINQGSADAENFTLSTAAQSGYTYASGTCLNTKLLKNGGNICTMTYDMNTSSIGSSNFQLNSVSASWSTAEEGNITGQSINWIGNDSQTIYANVYASAMVTTSLLDSSGNTMTAPYIVNVESSFKVKFELSGGYNVGNKSYTVNAPSGFNSTQGTCQVSSRASTCEVPFIAASTASADNVITVVGNPTPSPNNFTVSVIAPSRNKWVFVSQSSPQGDMFKSVPPYNDVTKYPNGIARADAICQHDAESTSWIPADKGAKNMTWKAMLVDGVNRQALPTAIDWVFEPGTTYNDIKTESNIGTVLINRTFKFPLTTTWGQYYRNNMNQNVWDQYNNFLSIYTGLNADWTTKDKANCDQYTNNTNSFVAAIGVPLQSYSYNPFDTAIYKQETGCQSTDKINSYAVRLVCVSQ